MSAAIPEADVDAAFAGAEPIEPEPAGLVPAASYPTARDHQRRWAGLARAIAADRDERTDDSARLGVPSRPGQLTILGSGIETAGFTAADEALIRAADQVFYCVADPATAVWLNSLRPDAYDLYVLYADDKKRYITYVEMTEAMLHYVRAGQHVVGIYYGHPGVFVLSTHRAIQIARREGHRAVMRSAVSALDTLCADLGIDPSQPGLQTFEATDMLIRHRQPDRTVHLVLWQVGLIGELGYRRQGFLNQGFGLLLDYLEKVYGPDHTVIHYVGSRYPGVDPVVEKHTIRGLRVPAAQAAVTGISTFYLPPQVAAEVDAELLAQLGLLRPGQSVTRRTDPRREIDRYGPREMTAFDDLAAFTVPDTYLFQQNTAAARFVLALRDSPALCARYVADPAGTVADWPDPELSAADRSYLERRDAGAVQIAAKGRPPQPSPDSERLLHGLLSRPTLARSLLDAVRSAPPDTGQDALDGWANRNGYTIAWDAMPYEIDRYLRRFWYPWTGLYLRPDVEQSLLLVAGRPSSGGNRLYVDGRQVDGVRYQAGVLRWTGAGDRSLTGHLRPDFSRGGRRLVGSIWPTGREVASVYRVEARAHPLPGEDPQSAPLAGTLRVRLSGRNDVRTIDVLADHDRLGFDGRTWQLQPSGDNRWTWQDGPEPLVSGTITTLTDPITGQPMIFGSCGPADRPGSVRISGIVVPTPDQVAGLLAAPRLNIPAWAWPHVLTPCLDAVPHGGLFLWHTWHNSVACLRMVRSALREARA